MAYCTQCGSPLPDTAKFCTKCGAQMIRSQGHVPGANAGANAGGYAGGNANGYAGANAGGYAGGYAAPQNMPYQGYQVPGKFQPISMWGYFGYSILFAIPVIGWIIALIMACGGTSNVNLKYFARSRFCVLLIAILLSLTVLQSAFL